MLNGHYITKHSCSYQFADLANFGQVAQNVTDGKNNVRTFTCSYDLKAVGSGYLKTHSKYICVYNTCDVLGRSDSQIDCVADRA